MLRSALQQSIQILQKFSALQPPEPHSQPQQPLTPQVSSLISAIAHGGIPRLIEPRLPEHLAARLHKLTESHFRQSCLATLQSGTAAADPLAVATQLKATYTKLYHDKVAEAVAAHVSRLSVVREKQPYSTDILLYAFDQSPTPTRREREKLSKLTGLTVEQVRVWFQNRRQRSKKRAPELHPRTSLQLEDVIARVAAYRKAADEDFEDDDSGYCSDSHRAQSTDASPARAIASLTVPSSTPRSYPAPYTHGDITTEFHCQPPVFLRTAAMHAPVYAQTPNPAELVHLMSRLTLRHRRQATRSSTGSTTSAVSAVGAPKPTPKSRKASAKSNKATCSTSDAPTRQNIACKDPETRRKVAGRRGTSAVATFSSSSSASPPPASSPLAASSPPTMDPSTGPRKRAGPLRRKPAGRPLARQASESSVASTSSSDSSRSTSYSSDFSLASDSSFTSVESAPTAASMDCFQPQQQPEFDPLAAFDFTQLFSSQPSDPLPQPVADFELPPDLLAGLQMPMDTAALPPPESTDFLALLNDPTIQDLLQSVQDMDVVAPQQAEQSFTFDNSLDVGTVDTSAFLDLSASTLPTFDAMFGLDASSFQDTLWNSPGFSLPITV